MSGDSINSLKMGKEEPPNLQDIEYANRLLEPFENIIERFTDSSTFRRSTNTEPKKSTFNIFVLIAIGLVLLLNFPKVRNELKLNEYVVWLISAFLLFGSVL